MVRLSHLRRWIAASVLGAGSVLTLAPSLLAGQPPVSDGSKRLAPIVNGGEKPPPAVPSVAQQLPLASNNRQNSLPAQNPPQVGGTPTQEPTRDPLNRLLEPTLPLAPGTPQEEPTLANYVYFPTLGFAGQSGVRPRSGNNAEYDTIEDRWRIGLPEWDRYGKGHPRVDDSPYTLGRWFDPYNQNWLKGDYPVLGQHTFFNYTGTFSTLFEGRSIPTATTPFESTARENTVDFFGRPGQFVSSQLLQTSFELFHGDASFKPVDWKLKLTPAFNVNVLSVQELAVVSPDVRKGTIRERTWSTLQEYCRVQACGPLAPADFVSVRVGSQPFTKTSAASSLATCSGYSAVQELRRQPHTVQPRVRQATAKDTNGQLGTFDGRGQNIVVTGLYRRDFIFPGYRGGGFHYNNDNPSFFFDKNGFLVRYDPVGEYNRTALTRLLRSCGR
ncbi:MAG: hypothetical protein U0792_15190 [Gemmataceae bacterium]